MNPVVRRVLPSLALNAALPLLGYVLVRPHTGTDTVALLICAAIPLLVTAGEWIWRRRVDPVGLLSIAGFGVVALVLWLTGGDALVVKLHETIVTGPLGVVFVVSALIGHPALAVMSRMSGRPTAVDPWTRRVVSVMTVLLGLTLVVHALVVLALAMSLSTTTFLAARPVGWLVVAAGLAAVFGYRSRALRNRPS